MASQVKFDADDSTTSSSSLIGQILRVPLSILESGSEGQVALAGRRTRHVTIHKQPSTQRVPKVPLLGFKVAGLQIITTFHTRLA
ncbi:hypothetical protein PoB_007703700 [Plakobranchus ocellatus]|uniref:Uncharacterized protein n=1 Tax=Plakobranchus ocellatus TaxID=259542 RepID=A0AAV4E1R9_9GAST|nr:hypothetical protein PoB_007703700 [Plakobranchus ocellatus]